MNNNLGRGLSAFLDEDFASNEKKSDFAENNDGKQNSFIKIQINKITENPYQPRRVFDIDALNSLAESIKNNGVIQPILVIKINDNGDYQLVAGERRFRAAKIAGMDEIPALVTSMNKKEQLEIAILENIQRENLTPIEEAEGYKRLINEFNYTQEKVAEVFGKSRSHVTNILRLLSLPQEVQKMLADGEITFGHARAIIGTENAADLARKIVKEELNVRQIENLIKNQKNNDNEKQKDHLTEHSMCKGKYEDPEIMNIIQQISTLAALPANIKLNNKGGVVEIYFKNFNELDAFVNKLNPLGRI